MEPVPVVPTEMSWSRNQGWRRLKSGSDSGSGVGITSPFSCSSPFPVFFLVVADQFRVINTQNMAPLFLHYQISSLAPILSTCQTNLVDLWQNPGITGIFGAESFKKIPWPSISYQEESEFSPLFLPSSWASCCQEKSLHPKMDASYLEAPFHVKTRDWETDVKSAQK